MSFSLLFKDELKGFYKSKVMIFLWIGLPLMTLILHLISPYTGDEIPLSLLSSFLVSSIGGTLASAMLAVSIIHEKDQHTYDLFLIRPIKRWHLMISKFLAVYLCIAIASVLAIALGIAVDLIESDIIMETLLQNTFESCILSLAMTAVASAVGILIGIVSPSVLVGVILVIYIGSNISSIPSFPVFFGMENSTLITISAGVISTLLLLGLGVYAFDKKQF